MKLNQIIRWIGMILFLSAYIGVSNGIISGQNIIFQFLNFFGALRFAVNAFYNKVYPIFVMEIIWAFIAIFIIIKIYI